VEGKRGHGLGCRRRFGHVGPLLLAGLRRAASEAGDPSRLGAVSGLDLEAAKKGGPEKVDGRGRRNVRRLCEDNRNTSKVLAKAPQRVRSVQCLLWLALLCLRWDPWSREFAEKKAAACVIAASAEVMKERPSPSKALLSAFFPPPTCRLLPHAPQTIKAWCLHGSLSMHGPSRDKQAADGKTDRQEKAGHVKKI
jgi:hypothetical protein